MVYEIRNLKLRYGYQWNSHMTNGPDTVAAHKIDLIVLLGSIQNYQNKRSLVCMLTHEIHWSCHSKIKYPWSCIIFYIPSTKVIIKSTFRGIRKSRLLLLLLLLFWGGSRWVSWSLGSEEKTCVRRTTSLDISLWELVQIFNIILEWENSKMLLTRYTVCYFSHSKMIGFWQILTEKCSLRDVILLTWRDDCTKEVHQSLPGNKKSSWI